MTPYTKLTMHLERHAYKRGMYKGDAPADSSRRSKNHFRVVKQGDLMCVRMYGTNIIEVTPDNKVTISTGGWWTSTTKQNLNDALSTFIGWGGVGNRRLFSYNQPCVRAKGKDYRFYDGMEFDAEGNLLSTAKVFERVRTDRDATKEFRADMQACGFKEVWPVLFGTAEPFKHWKFHDNYVRKVVTAEVYANEWADLAAHTKCYYDDHEDAYRAIVRQCTRGMTEIVKTDVSVI
jgi:hypothetical protein